MKFYGTLESLLEYSPGSNLISWLDSEKNNKNEFSLESLLQEKVNSLASILLQIQLEIKERKTLSGKVIAEIYQHYSYLKYKLFEMYQWPLGGNKAIESRRSNLESQLDALNQEARQEKVKAWQDISSLKKEFRTWFKQHSDLAQRVKLVLKGRPNNL